MKIQTPTEFLTFNSGVCEIYEVKGNQLVNKLESLPFGDRVIGYKRAYVAKTASNEISRLVHVPLRESIVPNQNAIIKGIRYRVDLAQPLYDTNPPVSVLTLFRLGVMK